MASINETTPAPAAEPKIEVTINKKPTADATPDDQNEKPEVTGEPGMPKLDRQNSIDSFISIDDYRRPRHHTRNPPVYVRPYTPSPIRRRHDPIIHIVTPLFDKSSCFLDSVGKFEGTVELPRPSRGFIYLTTYPFSDKDVKKWSCLFSLNVDDVFLDEDYRGRGGRDVDFGDGEILVYPTARRARNDYYYNDPLTIDVPSVYLSRALDKEVVPEDTANVTYLIVIQNRHRPAGSKLLVAESRKAAGIMMYYEALKGDSVLFVGATVGLEEKRVHPKKFKKVESLEEAIKVKDEGLVGIIC